MRTRLVWAMAALCGFAVLNAQDLQSSDPKDRRKAARQLSESGAEAIPQLRPLLKDTDPDVRLEAVKSIVAIGTQHSLDALVEATRDNNPEIQMRAVDGLVNFYVPGYVKAGLQRFGAAVRGRFDRENTDAIDPYITVRPEIIEAIGRLARGGANMESRANAARAVGILRGRAAVPDLIAALSSKDDSVIYESLIAMQKIGDPSAGPRITYLLRDLHEPVQIAAIETTGLLKTREAIPELQKIAASGRSPKVRRMALTSLSMMADESSRSLFEKGLEDKNELIRGSAAEGFGRLKNTADRPLIEKAFSDERKMPARLGQAFALVALGDVSNGEVAPLTYLVNTLNSKSYRETAEPYLTELAREPQVRNALYDYLQKGTKEEQMGLARVFARSGDAAALPHLEWLSKNPDPVVAQEGIRALRILRARPAR